MQKLEEMRRQREERKTSGKLPITPAGPDPTTITSQVFPTTPPEMEPVRMRTQMWLWLDL